MLKKIFIVLLITYRMNAMEVSTQDLVLMPAAEQKNCHLARLPTEIQNYIAQNLIVSDRESEIEFIERTKTDKQVINKNILPVKCSRIKFRKMVDYYTAFSPDQTKIVNIELLRKRFACEKPMLTIFNRKTKSIMYCQQHDVSAPLLIAISSCGNWFANIKTKLIAIPLHTERILIVENMLACKEQEFMIPINFPQIYAIGFNKNGTKIIVHGISYKRPEPFNNSPMYHNLIFQFNHGQVDKNVQCKTLHEYLIQHRVCKNLIF